MIAVMGLPALADSGSEIALTYIWTAHEGQEERLVATYGAVGEMLEANEPGLISYEIAVSETGNQIVIHEVLKTATLWPSTSPRPQPNSSSNLLSSRHPAHSSFGAMCPKS